MTKLDFCFLRLLFLVFPSVQDHSLASLLFSCELIRFASNKLKEVCPIVVTSELQMNPIIPGKFFYEKLHGC